MRIFSEADFWQHVTLGTTTESISLEFKQDLHGFGAQDKEARVRGQLELARDVTALANSDGDGGCLLFGVSETSAGVAQSLHPFADAAARVAWIEQALINCTAPSTFSHTTNRIALASGGEIIAVNIEPSLTLVYVYYDGRIEVHVRTSHGKRRLNPNEMEQRIMDRSRAIRLELAAIATPDRLQRPITVVPGFYEWSQAHQYMPTTTPALARHIQEHQLELVLPEVHNRCVAIPLAYVDTCWTTADGSIGLGLKVRIVLKGSDTPRLEPI